MARLRISTAEVLMLGREAILFALKTAEEAGDAAAFYAKVDMRNPSHSYWVRHGGIDISLKAVVACALRVQRSDAQAKDFHAADAAVRLRELGFEVIHGDCVTPL